jgi:hypothetical protein
VEKGYHLIALQVRILSWLQKYKEMIKCVDKGIWTCISKSGVPKKSYDDSDAAISAAKLVNKHDPKETTKLVAYKCTHCHKYHLLTVNKKIK